MSTNTTINGICFIIPNSARRQATCIHAEDWTSLIISVRDDLQSLGIKDVLVPESDDLVEVWVFSPKGEERGSTNWSCHGHMAWKHDEGKRFPQYLPATLLANKVEGDIFTLHGDGMDFQITCQQVDTRYALFGRFEEVFEKVTK